MIIPTLNHTAMTPKSWTILAIRAIVLIIFFQALGALGYSVYEIGVAAYPNTLALHYELAISIVYIIILFLLLVFSDRVAKALSTGLRARGTLSGWNELKVTAIAIFAVSGYIILSAIPRLSSNLIEIVARYDHEMTEGSAEKYRFNTLLFGLIGSVIQIAVASYVFVKAKYFARVWNRWQRVTS